MDEERATRLSDGMRAVIRSDRFVPGAFELVVDGTPQSHVDLDDPTHLFFEYIARMGHVIDQLRMPGEPITALHLGAGALTLPRYVEATRPGSRQQVIELEPALVDLVRAELPLPRGASIRMRYGDAREVLGRLPNGLHGAADLIVVDIFGGDRIPAHVTSLEFYRQCGVFLAEHGVLLVNVADGVGAAFARGQASTLVSAFADVAVLAESQVLTRSPIRQLRARRLAVRPAARLDAASARRRAASGAARPRRRAAQLDRRRTDRDRLDGHSFPATLARSLPGASGSIAARVGAGWWN